MIHWDTMQPGDSTRVHRKNNILNSIEKVNSSQFLDLVYFPEVIVFMLGIYSAPGCTTAVEVFTYILFHQLYYSR